MQDLVKAETERIDARVLEPACGSGNFSLRQQDQWGGRKATPTPSGYTDRPAEFLRLILPHLSGVTPSVLAQATGLSPATAPRSAPGGGFPIPATGPRCSSPVSGLPIRRGSVVTGVDLAVCQQTSPLLRSDGALVRSASESVQRGPG